MYKHQQAKIICTFIICFSRSGCDDAKMISNVHKNTQPMKPFKYRLTYVYWYTIKKHKEKTPPNFR